MNKQKKHYKTKKKESKLYCICKSTECKTFMIQCDICNEWYHGKCMGIEEIYADCINSFECSNCSASNKPDYSLDQEFQNKKNIKPRKRSNYDQTNQSYDIQCTGFQCLNNSRINSKYCCDECGIKVALKRIECILPERLQNWKDLPSDNDKFNKKISNLLRKRETCQQKLDHIDKMCQQKLDQIDKFKKLKYEEPSCTEEDNQEIICFICGHDLQISQSQKHFQKCYAKAESGYRFGTFCKCEKIISDVICNHYMESSQLYCKRLKLMCPEHYKEQVVPYEICGYPLSDNNLKFNLRNCRNYKSDCTIHYNWDRLLHANFHLQKFSLLCKLDTLNTEIMYLEKNFKNRGNFLGILLHNTKIENCT
ncbi:hypothetical protein A3Q56_01314 [Intoshia linei]|uniref:CXXC-type zinc finger protein 1 n=1 Tax=Intoshia linei TaxID=1819745 RepID=A0A177B9H1_9BILA|nr:hypothetical protein A3Q56_01314 [Intoshia linei]